MLTQATNREGNKPLYFELNLPTEDSPILVCCEYELKIGIGKIMTSVIVATVSPQLH